MKFVTRRDPLQHALAVTARGVSGRSTLPILSNILIEATDGQVQLSATDLDLSVRAAVAVEVEEPGRTTLPARLFAEVVGAQPDGLVTFERDDRDHVTFRSGRSVLEVHGLPADEFPALPQIKAANTVTVPQKLLRRMLQQTLIAVSNDETRTRLTGMLMCSEGRVLRLVSTDTHRLATRGAELPGEEPQEFRAIVPGRALRELERLLKDDDSATVAIDFTDSQVQFRADGVSIITRVIEGEFPNYRRAIPAGTSDWSVTVAVARLRDSVRRCAIVSREDNRKLKLRATPTGELQLEAQSARIGRADEEVEGAVVQAQEGVSEALEIAFNADYLLDVLNQVGSEELTIGLSGPNAQGILRPVDDEDYVYVLMPMQMV